MLNEFKKEGHNLPESFIKQKRGKGKKKEIAVSLTQMDIETIQKLPDYESKIDIYWDFKPENFNLKEECFTQEDDKKRINYHLHHLSFAIFKAQKELKSGGRHRSKYFEEIKKDIERKNHSYGFLKNFFKKLHDGEFAPLNSGSLTFLIGNLSNLELKPLRKYFNQKDYRTGDRWEEVNLEKIFDRWIRKEWRVDTEKDRDKAVGKKGDYEELKRHWASRSGSVVDFWLINDPFYTIPPYQNNNNRRPPRCQSLILNPSFLNNKLPGMEGMAQLFARTR